MGLGSAGGRLNLGLNIVFYEVFRGFKVENGIGGSKIVQKYVELASSLWETIQNEIVLSMILEMVDQEIRLFVISGIRKIIILEK